MENIENLLDKASELYYSEHYSEEALRLAQEAYAMAPHSLRANNILGNCLLEHGYYQAAEEKFRFCIEQKPDSPTVNMALGLSLRYMKKFQEAEFYLERAFLLDEGNPTRTEVLAGLYLEWGTNLIYAAELVDDALHRVINLEQRDRLLYLKSDLALALKSYDIDAPYPS